LHTDDTHGSLQLTSVIDCVGAFAMVATLEGYNTESIQWWWLSEQLLQKLRQYSRIIVHLLWELWGFTILQLGTHFTRSWPVL